MEGGPLRRLQWALGLPRTVAGVVCFGGVIALLTWVPLAVLCAITQNFTSGPALPFLQSLGTHVRLLVAIPLFFLAEATFDLRVREAIGAMVSSEIVPARQLARFGTALSRAERWRDAWILEGLPVALTVLLIVEGVRGDLPGSMSTWRNTADGRRSAAGWWYILVSLPIYQLLVWRWCARLLIWCDVLWRIRALDLQLLPTHPGHAGGLGGLGVAHMALGPLNFALAAMAVASTSEELPYGVVEIRRVVLPLAVQIVGATLLLVAPLLFFVSRLLDTKQRGTLEYGALASTYTRAFHRKWLRGNPPAAEPLLGSADLQSLADLANSFAVIRDMRLVPMERHQFLLLLGRRHCRPCL
jgi:hypothetical protein